MRLATAAVAVGLAGVAYLGRSSGASPARLAALVLSLAAWGAVLNLCGFAGLRLGKRLVRPMTADAEREGDGVP